MALRNTRQLRGDLREGTVLIDPTLYSRTHFRRQDLRFGGFHKGLNKKNQQYSRQPRAGKMATLRGFEPRPLP
jgi:hypothetical protein